PAAYSVTGPFHVGARQRKPKLTAPPLKAFGWVCEISPPTTWTSLPAAWNVPAAREDDTPRPAVTAGPPEMVTVKSAMVPASSTWGPLMVTVGVLAPGAWQAAQVAPFCVPGLPEKPLRPCRLASALPMAKRNATADSGRSRVWRMRKSPGA